MPQTIRKLVVAGVVLVLVVAAGTGGWVWWIRPRHLVEVHDDSGRISVRVPRGWADEVRGPKSEAGGGHLQVGPADNPRVWVTVVAASGTFEYGDRCGRKPEKIAGSAPSADLWVVRDCPDGQITLFMSKPFTGYGYAPVTAAIEVRADDEKFGRRVLDSVTYRRGS